MPTIVIQEKDETLAGASASSVDVAFVPGFANTNANYVILTVSGETPTNCEIPGSVPNPETEGQYATSKNIHVKLHKNPCFACNTVDQITWYCSGTYVDDDQTDWQTWEEQPNYVAPSPENYPVLCSSLAEFEAYFGKEPYKFGANQDVSDLFEADAVAIGSKYMYRAGDYDRSYIYAKELISLGIPVIYENICDRGSITNNFETTYNRNVIRVTGVTIGETYEEYMMDQLGILDPEEFRAMECKFRYNRSAYQYFTATSRGPVIGADGTPAVVLTPATAVPYVNDVITVIYKNDAYSASFTRESSIPETSVDPAITVDYLQKHGTSKTINKTFTYTSTGWKSNIPDETVTPGQLGISISGIPALSDEVVISGSYAQTFTKAESSENDVRFLYANLADCFTNSEKLLDKGELTVKYITTGAYPVYELKEEYSIVGAMVKCAHDRNDAVAIIDHYNNPERSLQTTQNSGSVFAHLHEEDPGLGYNTDEYTSFATMFTPWATYTCTTAPKGATTQLLPASFGYLTSVGVSIVTNANFLATAGVNRGIPPTIKALNTISRLSNTIADNYQPRDSRALNSITNIKPYGLTIWGNRTLVSNADGNLKATSFLNVRNMSSDIKKVAYTAAKSLMYEQDTEILWGKFKSKITPTLDKMVNGYGLKKYQIIRGKTKYNGEMLGKGEVAAVIKIYPVYAVESFEVTVVMSDEGVSVN